MIRIKPNLPQQDPDGEIENSGKIIFEIRIPNFCYIQILVFYLKLKLSTSGRLPLAAVWTQQVRYHWQIAKVKNYNLNVTEVRDSDFKNAFPGIFNFTVGILVRNSFLSQLHGKTSVDIHIPSKFHTNCIGASNLEEIGLET